MTTSDCLERSLEVIAANQSPSGAYVASPDFPHYRYCWLRDGTFTAYAMDRQGQHESAGRFYDWCARVMEKHEAKARMAIAAVNAGETGQHHGLFLHTRYTVDGDEVPGEWGHFQLDGYGTWLWGLAGHLRMTNQPQKFARFRRAVEVTVDYLEACWRLPNFDCWEEFPDRVHPATLAAIYGGLTAIAPLCPERAAAIAACAEQIRSRVLSDGVADGVFTKSLGHRQVDASLLWLSVPFGLVEERDSRMAGTVRAIERELLNGWGVHRYRDDVYYGGGQWLLLSAWLGWYYARIGEREKAADICAWIEGKCGDKGLPEQVQDVLLAPAKYQEWVERAGEPACPLLWSHAMYLVLRAELDTDKT